jgi:LPXTG-motif cell wall-anchored protein
MHLAQTRRRLRLVAATAAVALLGLAFAASPAHADPAPTGTLTWGFKEAFRTYLSNVGGTTTGVAPATGSGVVTFPVATLDENGGTFTGGIQFLYAAHGINITLTNLEIEVTGDDTAKLIVDIVTGAGTTADAHIADLTKTNETPLSVTFSAVMADGGVAAFRSYPKGTALDPVTVTIDALEPTNPSTSATPTPDESSSAPATPGGELPTTGANTGVYIGAGVLLVAAGAGALLIARRRRDTVA